MDNYFEIGKIAGTHGIKGTLRIFPTTDEPDRFSLLKEVIVEYKNEKKVCKVNKVAYHKNFVLLSLRAAEYLFLPKRHFRSVRTSIIQEICMTLTYIRLKANISESLRKYIQREQTMFTP